MARIAGALVVLGALAAVWTLQPGSPGPDTGSATATGPRPATPVVIYLVDTLRADHLQVYGYPKPTSPTLQALAGESVVFEHAYAPAPWTLPSVASLVTSTFACEHGITRPGLTLDPAFRTLAEHLRDRGYATAAYYSNLLAGPAAGLDRGYEVSRFYDALEPDIADATRFLDAAQGKPFFVYLHTMPPHQPYLTEYPYTRHFGHVSVEQRAAYEDLYHRYSDLKTYDMQQGQPRGTTDNTAEQQRVMAGFAAMRDAIRTLYDGSVRWTDETLGRVIELLKARNLWDETLLIVLADHGEAFGEHDIWFHEQSVYDPIMRVPLMIRFPRGEFGGQRIGTQVSLVDVMPTVLDFLGNAEACATCRGSSLMPLLRGNASVREGPLTGLRINQTTYYRPVKERRGDVNVMVRRDQWKAIWNQEPDAVELYDLGADPGEQADLSATEPRLAAELKSAATRWMRECSASLQAPAKVELDERTQEKLRALGYAH